MEDRLTLKTVAALQELIYTLENELKEIRRVYTILPPPDTVVNSDHIRTINDNIKGSFLLTQLWLTSNNKPVEFRSRLLTEERSRDHIFHDLFQFLIRLTTTEQQLQLAKNAKDEKIELAKLAMDENIGIAQHAKKIQLAEDEKVRLAQLAKEEKIYLAELAQKERIQLGEPAKEARTSVIETENDLLADAIAFIIILFGFIVVVYAVCMAIRCL
ncbi:hypothetical protein EDD21DRAFT_386923 [Dissophora ornata]|nr:hypothetical protein BGZ58_010708 [Dissophora ornata]KAI8596908.1 hypothetical protein EDD21DRAFT_386923 [Dissophora ornata]